MNKYFKNYDKFYNSNIPRILVCENNEYVIIENSFFNKGVYVGELKYNYILESKKIEFYIKEDWWDTTKDVASSVGEFVWNIFKFPESKGDAWLTSASWVHYILSMTSLASLVLSPFTLGGGAALSKGIDIADVVIYAGEACYAFSINNQTEFFTALLTFAISVGLMALPGAATLIKNASTKIRSYFKGGGKIIDYFKKFPEMKKVYLSAKKGMSEFFKNAKLWISNLLKGLLDNLKKFPKILQNKFLTIISWLKKFLSNIDSYEKTINNKLGILDLEEKSVASLSKKTIGNLKDYSQIIKKFNYNDEEVKILNDVFTNFRTKMDDSKIRINIMNLCNDKDILNNILKNKKIFSDKNNTDAINLLFHLDTKIIKNNVLILPEKQLQIILDNLKQTDVANGIGTINNIFSKTKSIDNTKFVIDIISNQKIKANNIASLMKVAETNDDVIKNLVTKNKGDIFKTYSALKDPKLKLKLIHCVDDKCDIFTNKISLNFEGITDILAFAKKMGLPEESNNVVKGFIIYKGNKIASIKELKQVIKNTNIINKLDRYTIVRRLGNDKIKSWFNTPTSLTPEDNNSDEMTIIEDSTLPIDDTIINELQLQKIENVANSIRTDEQKQAIVDFCKNLNSKWILVSDKVLNMLKDDVNIEKDKTKYVFDSYDNLKPYIKLLQTYFNKYVKLEEPLKVDGVIGTKTLTAAIKFFQNKPQILEETNKLIDILQKQ